MTIEEMKRRVAELKVQDAEVAHAGEDAIHCDALQHIADCSTDPDARAIALVALSTLDIPFRRWFA